MSWALWIHAFADALESRGVRATVADQVRWLWRFEGFCRTWAVSEPAAVTPVHVALYEAYLAERYTPNTQRHALMSIRSFFRWAIRCQRLLLEPTAFVELPAASQPDTIFLTPRQVEALLLPQAAETTVQHRNRILLETLYGTAIRRCECRAIDLADLNLRDGWLRVFGKGGKERLVVVGPHLTRLLQAYLAESRPRLVWHPSQTALFVTAHGDRMTDMGIQDVVHTAAQRIGMSRLGAHALRRSCVTHMLAAGADIQAVQQLLGHASLQPTERYLQLRFEDLQAEHRRTHPRGG